MNKAQRLFLATRIPNHTTRNWHFRNHGDYYALPVCAKGDSPERDFIPRSSLARTSFARRSGPMTRWFALCLALSSLKFSANGCKGKNECPQGESCCLGRCLPIHSCTEACVCHNNCNATIGEICLDYLCRSALKDSASVHCCHHKTNCETCSATLTICTSEDGNNGGASSWSFSPVMLAVLLFVLGIVGCVLVAYCRSRHRRRGTPARTTRINDRTRPGSESFNIDSMNGHSVNVDGNPDDPPDYRTLTFRASSESTLPPTYEEAVSSG